MTDWQSEATRFENQADRKRLQELTSLLGVRVAALKSLGVGWDPARGDWTFPERDGSGAVIGLLRRSRNGSKKVAKGGRRGLYITAELAERPGPVLLPEGASDTAAMLSCGAAAVGRPSCDGGGELLVELFTKDARELVVVGDNDEKDGNWPGRTGAQATAALLATRLKKAVKVAMPPGGFKDVRDWVIDYNERESRLPDVGELMAALAGDCQIVAPDASPAQTQESEVTVLANYAVGQRDHGKTQCEGLPLERMREALLDLTGGWPRRVDNELFVIVDGKPFFVNSTAQLFAWMDMQCLVDWRAASDCVSQERFFEGLRMTAQAYEAIELLPHFPALPGTYYCHPGLPSADGQCLERLVGFFCPETPTDREQIKALIMTLFWGGPPGARPAALITGPDQDVRQGRGLGKSTLLALLGELAGGFTEVQTHEDMPAVIKRLLSPDARSLRMARLDNVKTLRLSWAELEALITSPVISGHRLYKGEGRRPNHLLWGITLNGGSLSKDFAQRCRFIRLARPQYDPTWDACVANFIQQHRWQILADVKQALERPGEEQLASIGRWPTWQREVLAKVERPDECEQLNLLRQRDMDDDAQEQDLVVAHFRKCLADKGFNPDRDFVFIPTATLHKWLADATGEARPITKVTAYLRTLAIPQMRYVKRHGCPGWTWRGAHATPRTEVCHVDHALQARVAGVRTPA
jgi:hypothetical protein